MQRSTRDYGQVAFTPVEFMQTFDAPVGWVVVGVKPAGGNVLDPAEVSDPNFGCKWADNIRPRQWDQPGLGLLKPPACPAP